LSRIDELRDTIRAHRKFFVGLIVNNTDVSNLERLVSVELSRYETVVQSAAQGGLEIEADKDYPTSVDKWSILQAVFFSSTVLTTIGES
jgi:potassium channel subfamily K, invertebrate